MLHAENAQVDSQPVHAIEGEPNNGTVFVKPLMDGEHMALLEVHMRAGVSSSLHAHAHESVLYVVSGKLTTVVNDETFVLAPGDVCRHPRDAVSSRGGARGHGIRGGQVPADRSAPRIRARRCALNAKVGKNYP